ncbi:MAG: phosphoribosyl-AMP cyclohydrolase [Acidobacteria bacterium]|nr:MAG: phosphoribosyl-AMP cyclohydrolase [Acidobacteriota bacterium]
MMNAEFDFDKMGGLLPTVVQDAITKEVLMVGFMNREALERTLERGYVTFFSRTRNRLWTKGETSGNQLRVVSVHTDCDRDTLLLLVAVQGAGVVCHRGTRSCFTESVAQEMVAEAGSPGDPR